MNFHNSRRFLVLSSSVAVCALSFSTSSAKADDEAAPLVDLAAAKAELAKSKAAEAESAESKKPTRKRWLGRGENEKAEEKQEAPPKLEKSSTEGSAETAPEKESKSRPRLFKRDKAEPEDIEIDIPQPEKSTAEKEKSGPLKRLSPFGKNKDAQPEAEKKETAAPTPEPEKIAAAETSPEVVKNRKIGGRLIGGMFASKDSVAKTPEPEKKSTTDSNEEPGLFSPFRKKESSDFAKAEKTKLGKTVDTAESEKLSTAATTPAAGGALTKKSVDTGELGWYVVTESSAPFYAVGPGQPMPPEKLLDRGSMLTVTKGGWGWCNVRLGSGELGVVSAKSMRPATVAEVTRHTQPVATASSSRESRSLFNILSRGPAPKLDLPVQTSDAPIRNFGLLPSLTPEE